VFLIMRKRLLCSALALFTWGCGDGSTPPAVATAVAVAPGSIALDAVGARQVVRATVADQNGKPMNGAALTWASSSAAVSVASAGGDSAIVTAAANGSATITATAGSASGTAGAQVAQVATSVQMVSGDAQTGSVAAALGQPLRVRAMDRLGAPAVGVTLSFAIVEGGGTLSAASAVTGADGTATVAWMLGTASGSQHRVRASAPGVAQAVEFTATANPGPAVAAVIMGGNGQLAAPNATVAVPPSVSMRDVYGNPVEGVTVQFSVTSGGGSITGGTVSSGLGGFATVGSWRLGAAAGANTLTATFPGTAIPAVVFTATASAVATGTISIVQGQNQGAMVGTALPAAPSVVVRDAAGAPLPGLTVTFTPSDGGSVGSTTVTTGANGVASPGNWVLGPTPGPSTLRASVAGIAAAVEFRGIGCQGGGAGYQLTLCFTTPMTPSQRTVFQNAAARWATVITGDVPDLTFDLQAGTCGAGTPTLDMTFDDLVIFAAVQPIDGPGQVLGSAGPCLIRNPGNLPVVGVMRFDEADVAALEASGGLNAVILHEMGHVLGIGTMWKTFGLLQNESSAATPRDTWYSGAHGLAGFDAVGGSTYTGGQKVPVENTGGPGTANGHWRESVLGRELMTGYLNSNGANPLSMLTVRSLTDMGYTVNTAAADAFSVTLSVRAEGSAAPTLLRLHNDIYTGPRYRVDRQGRITRDGN
jgi:hypothetical protein